MAKKSGELTISEAVKLTNASRMSIMRMIEDDLLPSARRDERDGRKPWYIHTRDLGLIAEKYGSSSQTLKEEEEAAQPAEPAPSSYDEAVLRGRISELEEELAAVAAERDALRNEKVRLLERLADRDDQIIDLTTAVREQSGRFAELAESMQPALPAAGETTDNGAVEKPTWFQRMFTAR